MELIRPGSPTANSIILRKGMGAGGRPIALGYWWVQRVRYRDFTDTDTSQALALNTAFPANAFPTDVFLTFGPTAYFDLIQEFAGGTVSAATLILGITGDTNGLIESTNVFTGASTGRKYSAANATLYAEGTLDQAAMAPLLQLDTTTGNINELTAGIVDVYIPFAPACSRRPVNGF